MSKRTNTVSELFLNGNNCAQAVLAVFCEEYGLDAETAVKLACGLGSGARCAELCGAVSGAVLVIGLKYGDSKEVCNAKTEDFIKRFRAKNGDIVCRELLKCDICTSYGREQAVSQNLFTTRCLDLVVSAVQILEELIGV